MKMCDFEKFCETLPSKNEFYILLSGKGVRDEEYQYVLKVWNKFGRKVMQQFHDLFLKCDFLLSADVFERFRNKCLENYGLCCSHHLREPALSWDAMLNMTKVKLNLISDVDIYLFFE